MVDENILKECEEIVEQVCQKFNYATQDVPGNDCLKTVLLRATIAMLKDCNKEGRELFYQMLLSTPIVVTEELTQEDYDKLVEQYIGKDINQHIISEKSDLGEYGKGVAAGAYVSEVILDENMNLQGKKSFVFIQRVQGKAKEFFGTDINVSHLIHELGHAWHSEKNQFVMQEDGTLKERVGTSEFIYSFLPREDNKVEKKCISLKGLMIEEAMNTIDEEKAMANYMNISLEEMRERYRDTLIPSNYQGYMSGVIEYMMQQIGRDDLESYRLYGNPESKDRINKLMEQTDYWINRETDILPSSNSPRSYDKKREILDRMSNENIQDFFAKYENVYFPDISTMTPLEKIDNVLEQSYNLNMMKYGMGIDNYKDFLERLGYEGYSLINQSANLKRKQELLNLVSDVRSSELDSITQETKNIALEERGEHTNDERN